MINSDLADLAEVLESYVIKSGYKPIQLARLSGIPKPTIVNWLNGRVKKPQNWQDLLKLGAALHLDGVQCTRLLESAGYPSVEILIQQAQNNDERTLLSPWTKNDYEEPHTAPFQVIPDLPYFVGRETDLQTLQHVLLNKYETRICCLQGMGGVGKTTLAARLAYRLRPHFPDGVLWAKVDTPNQMGILSSFAEAFGRDVSKYSDIENRSRVVRELLANKRVLIVLDNAQHSDQIVPLLPPTTGSCAVIITTRRHDLAVTFGGYRFTLNPFDIVDKESIKLFMKLLGNERVHYERAYLESIAAVLDHFPLAIAIVGNRLAYEPGWTAKDFLARLCREELRLGELACEDMSVQLSFNTSYDLLSPEKQRFFNFLGVLEGEDFNVEAAAYISEMSMGTAQDYLRELYSLSLAQTGRDGRYRLHPLLRDYAREKIRSKEAVLRRMCLYFTSQIKENERNYAHLALEYENILAALHIAYKYELHSAFIQSVNLLYHFWETRGLYKVAKKYLRRVLRVARKINDKDGLLKTLVNLGQLMQVVGKYQRAKDIFYQGLALDYDMANPHLRIALLLNLGIVAFKQGDFEQSKAYLLRGRELACSIDDDIGLLRVLLNLGVLAQKKGDRVEAEVHLNDGLAIARKVKDKEKISHFLMNLGATVSTSGNYKEAEIYLLEGLACAEEIGHLERASLLLTNLGSIAITQRNYAEADAYLQQGLKLAYKIDNRERIAGLLVNLGVSAQESGELEKAENFLAEALRLAQMLGHFWLTMVTLCIQGKVYFGQKRYDLASESFNGSLQLAQKIGSRDYIADIKFGLAHILHTRGDHLSAFLLGKESLDIFTTLEHVKAAEVTDWINEIAVGKK